MIIQISGTLEEWRMAANMLFASGCEAQSFVVLASLAAPLMPLWRGKGNGAVVSIYGGKKSGKSTAIAGARSVWGIGYGPPPEDVPSISEGFINRDPKIMREGLNEAAADGELVISAAGMSLFAAISTPDDPFRLGVEFEIKVPAGLIAARDKNEIEYALYSNHGHAGAAMEAELADEKRAQAAKRMMSSYLRGMEEMFNPDKSDEPHALRIIAAARAAGDIAVKLKLLEIDPERIARWAFSKYGGPK
jgi:hypothetical protein